MLSKKRQSEIVLEIVEELKGHLFFLWNSKGDIFFQKVSVFLMFTCVHYSFPIFDWLCFFLFSSALVVSCIWRLIRLLLWNDTFASERKFLLRLMEQIKGARRGIMPTRFINFNRLSGAVNLGSSESKKSCPSVHFALPSRVGYEIAICCCLQFLNSSMVFQQMVTVDMQLFPNFDEI